MTRPPPDLQRLIALRRTYAPKFYDGLNKVELDPQSAFTCWNMLTTVVDMLVDLCQDMNNGVINPRSLKLGDHNASDLLGYVIEQIDPRSKP